MIHSMTGYGQTTVDVQEGVWSIEIKTVNHRYKDILFRMPRDLNYIEEELRKIISSYFARGRIEVFINFKQNSTSRYNITINEQKLNAYLTAIKKIQELTPELLSKINVSDVIRLPEIFNEVKDDIIYEKEEHPICIAIHKVLDNVNQFRASEGKRLIDDCIDKLAIIDEYIKKIKTVSHLVIIEYKDKLKNRLLEFDNELNQIDDSRLTMELVLFAEKSSIDEELVRLNSHLQQFIILVNNDKTVGRKLDFLLQEMNREVNTISAKTNNYEISSDIVSIKSELEKIREQIQNIE